ncbi:hypothetical protein JCM3774_006427 [Rhodotorula dairenensis]
MTASAPPFDPRHSIQVEPDFYRLSEQQYGSQPMTPIGIALVGPGLVGRLVLEQFASPALRPHFRVVSISNSRYTVFGDDEEGASQLSSSEEGHEQLLIRKLPASSAPSRDVTTKGVVELEPAMLIEELAERARRSGSHIILVDCTASDTLPRVYQKALLAGLSVVTPNKVAAAGPAPLWRSIVEAQASEEAGLFYCEGACGAGLPLLSTLTDLVRTGDEIVKIEAVLSGTLSYIFNQYSPVQDTRPGEPLQRFSDIVRTAHQDGHTEPHPAEDLSGRDVARKLTILARFSSTLSASSGNVGLFDLPNGSASVRIQSLVPEELSDPRSPEAFVESLAEYDDHFDRLRAEARAAGKVLRYVGILDRQQGTVECGLRQFAPDHPFASLYGSHLSFTIYTKRYTNSPLVIQGPGYPVEVTASAVVADAIRVAERKAGHNVSL